MTDLGSEIGERLTRGLHAQTERKLHLLVRPKPRWLPRRLWRAVVRRVVVLEEAQPTTTLTEAP